MKKLLLLSIILLSSSLFVFPKANAHAGPLNQVIADDPNHEKCDKLQDRAKIHTTNLENKINKQKAGLEKAHNRLLGIISRAKKEKHNVNVLTAQASELKLKIEKLNTESEIVLNKLQNIQNSTDCKNMSEENILVDLANLKASYKEIKTYFLLTIKPTLNDLKEDVKRSKKDSTLI